MTHSCRFNLPCGVLGKCAANRLGSLRGRPLPVHRGWENLDRREGEESLETFQMRTEAWEFVLKRETEGRGGRKSAGKTEEPRRDRRHMCPLKQKKPYSYFYAKELVV